MKNEKNQQIQPLAWFPNGMLPDTLRYVVALKMPPDLWRILRSIGPKIKEIGVAPISGLHDLIAAHSHHIIAFQPKVLWTEEASPRWLYLRNSHALDTEKLKNLIKSWLIATDKINGKVTANKIDSINWSWDESIDLQADPLLQKLLLPGLIAGWLLEQETPFQFKLGRKRDPEEIHEMRLVPIMSERGFAELVSEPRKTRSGAFSFVLRLWMQPVPLVGLALFARASVRRWHTRPLLSPQNWVESPKRNRNKSVYFRRETGYLEKDESSQIVFSRVRLRHFNKGGAKLHWVGNQAKVLEKTSYEGEFPDAETLARKPREYMEKFLLTKPAGAKDSTKTGLWSNDHRAIFQELTSLLEQWATPMPIWIREIAGDDKRSKSIYLQRLKKIVKNVEPKAAALQNLPAPARIVLHVNDQRLVKEIILCEVGLWDRYQHRLDENPLRITPDDSPNSPCLLEITISTDPKLTDTLRPPPKGHVLSAYHAEASQRRATEISKRTPKATQPSGYLVSLPRYDDPKKMPGQKWVDPKIAIRQGLLQSGYVSQFFDPITPDTEDHNRLTNAVRDLLRALGYRLNPLYIKPPQSSLPEQVDLIAFEIIQLNARTTDEKKVFMPVVMESPSDSNDFHVYLPRKTTGSPELYCSLYEANCALVTEKLNMDYENAADLIPFFRQVLEQRKGKRPALLLLRDQNLRRVFPELDAQDTELAEGVLASLLPQYPQIRVARLRYSFHDEAPLCVPTIPKSKYQGLYGHEGLPNVFYSLHNVGDQHVSSQAYKLDRTGKPAVNPSTMQILLHNLQPDDIPAEWAGVVHRLRQESSHIDVATRFPQPIHNRNKITEHLIRYDNESEQSSEDDSEEQEMES